MNLKEQKQSGIESHINFIKQKIAPLRLSVIQEIKQRTNILIPTIDFKYFFGGYIAKFNIAQELANQGKNIRIIIVDYCDFKPEFWKHEIKKYPGLEKIFEKVEVEYVYDRSNSVQVSKNDVFIATTWWTAHIANQALKETNRKKFLYLIQEFEPFTFVHGTYYALANETYDFPHYAIFSTDFLREFFRQNRIGIFKEKLDEVDINSISFENAITKFEINEKTLAKRGTMKFLFYARPEQHAARNMFELGVIALSNAIRNGCFNSSRWEFHGIGSVEQYKDIILHDDIELKLFPRLSLDEYKKLLPKYDLGLSLMLTPHPNLLTLEMAAAGMIVVTNSFANKNQKMLSQISSNILVAEPTISSVEQLLCLAVSKVNNFEKRIEGSKVNWATTWKESFNSEKMKKILQFIDMC